MDSFFCATDNSVFVNGAKSDWVLSGVQQGTVLSPLLLLLFFFLFFFVLFCFCFFCTLMISQQTLILK